MRLEDALHLKRGTKLVANITCLGPDKLTEGKTYVMQGDAILVYRTSGFITSRRKQEDTDIPCNAELPIIDDRGKRVDSCYNSFEISQ